MRIKSYFAPSVQSAIALARREFGDEVTLVTSHIAAADARHLGEYEVVFAIDEEEPVGEEDDDAVEALSASPPPEIAEIPDVDGTDEIAGTEETVEQLTVNDAPKFTAFQEALLGAVAKKPASKNVLEQIDSVRLLLIELGIEPAMVRALMTLVERSIPASTGPEAQEGTGAMLSQLAESLTTASTEVAVAPVEASVPVPEQAAVRLPAADNRFTKTSTAFANLTATSFTSTTWGLTRQSFVVPRPASHAAVKLVALECSPIVESLAGGQAKKTAQDASQARLTAAELAFVMSVSENADPVRR